MNTMSHEPETRVGKSVYYSVAYDTKERIISFWHQISEVLRLNPIDVLEIGCGNKFTSEYLRKQGIKITTVDVDESLEPDVCASVMDLPFDNTLMLFYGLKCLNTYQLKT